jgi:polygalacturonase
MGAMKTLTTRRGFVRALGAGVACSLAASEAAWAQVPEILRRIKPPRFPERDFHITKYGAVGDGVKDCTGAIREAIEACHAAGGGRVVAEAGRFLTGAIHLKSGVNLHVARGATLLFSTDPAHYLPVVFTRWEGTECMSYSPLIYAFGQRDIAITGEGTLDGQADNEHWWPWTGNPRFGGKRGEPNQRAARTALVKMASDGVPVEKRVFGEGSMLRPQFVQPYRCENVLIEGITIHNSPMWELHPVLSKNVTVRGVKIASLGPNNDGCDPECSKDVLIEDCLFETGDDCIAIKSGRNADGRRVNVPAENVVIRSCMMKDGHGGATIGSEVSGGVRNVFVENCQMNSLQLDRALRIKTNAMRGGVVEHIYMRNVQVGQVAEAIVSVNFYYEEGANGPYKPVVRHVGVSNVSSKKSQYALYLRGFADDPIEDVRLEDCTFDNVEKPNVVENVQGLTFKNVRINGKLAAKEG